MRSILTSKRLRLAVNLRDPFWRISSLPIYSPSAVGCLTSTCFTKTAQSVFGDDFTELVAQVAVAILSEHKFLVKIDDAKDKAVYRGSGID